jgi:ABC-type glycerol-3-phosphate transport system substrate-binding protein
MPSRSFDCRPACLRRRWAWQALGIVLFLIAGCSRTETRTGESASVDNGSKPPPPISVLFVDSAGIGEKISRQWSAQKDGKLTSVEATSAALYASQFNEIANHDVVVYPNWLIGELVARQAIIELPMVIWDSRQLHKMEILRASRTVFPVYGKKTWGTPLGSPNLMLIYRDDVLKALKLPPPRTWKEFFEIAHQLTVRQELRDGQGKLLPTAVDIPSIGGWESRIFLTFCAPAIRRRGKLASVFDRDTMDPLIDRQPFVESLENLKRLAEAQSDRYDIKQVARRIIDGKSAIAIGYLCRSFFDSAEAETLINEQVRFARLPGSEKWFDFVGGSYGPRDLDESIQVDLIGYSGRLASVLKSASDPNTCFDFITWVSSKQISEQIMSRTDYCGPFRASHLGNVFSWTGDVISFEAAESIADLIEQLNEEPIFLLFPRIPGSHEYLASLDRGINQYLASTISAEQALTGVAKEWQTITDRLDRKKQIRHIKLNEGY